MTRAIAVVPTLRRDVPSLVRLSGQLRTAGIEPVLVATGAGVDAALTAAGVPHLSPRANPGFGAAIEFGAAGADADWLFVCNDDVTITGTHFADAVADLIDRRTGDLVLAFFDPGPARPVPGPAGVFTSVALLDAVAGRLGRARRPVTGAWYKSFSLCAISAPLWRALDGFDPRLPYTYEDADFAARAYAAGASLLDLSAGAADHQGSGTSRRFVSRVLPVSVRSARNYLCARGLGPRRASALLAAALLVRALLVPVAPLPNGEHWRAVAASLRHLVGPAPRLPAYEDC